MINFDDYTFLYNADAHFKAMERYPDGFFTEILRSDLAGFNAVCWGLAEMSLQGELLRRYQGLDKKEYLTEAKVRSMLTIPEMPDAVKTLIDAINKGMKTEDDGEEIDEVLMELQPIRVLCFPRKRLQA